MLIGGPLAIQCTSPGHYTVKSKFVDDDGTKHLAWEWSFDLKKGW